MIEKIHIENFRCYKSTTIKFKQLAIMVGKNNAGKSTLIEALRIISVISNRINYLNFKPAPSWIKNNTLCGVSPSIDNLSISTQNIFYLYGEPPAKINITFENNVSINAFIGENAEIFAVLYDANKNSIFNKKQLKDIVIPPINILPQISPLLQEEKIIKKSTVQSNQLTRLSSRNFRNQIYYFEQDFDRFKELSEITWNGLEINNISIHGEYLSLFIRDNNFTAEIGWMGHGLQMWLQTMWFLSRASSDSTVILDEPDIYMHADLQRKLIRLIKSKYKQVIIATHSVEIMSEVEPNNILMIEKEKTKLTYANKAPIVQKIIDNIGSVHNIEIVRLFSSKKFIITEGYKDDIKILSIFQSILYPQTCEPFNIIPKTNVEGWGGWQRVIGSSNVFKKNELEIKVYCIFDADYHMDEEKEERYKESQEYGINLHIWERKEIENYTINHKVICRYINQKKRKGNATEEYIKSKIESLCLKYKEDIIDNFATEIDKKERELVFKSVKEKAKHYVNSKWDNSIALIPGKQMIKDLSTWSKETYGVSFNSFQIAKEFNRDEIPTEIQEVIKTIEFCNDF